MNCSNCNIEADKLYHADRDNLLCEDCYTDLCAAQENEYQEYLAMERYADQEAYDAYELRG